MRGRERLGGLMSIRGRGGRLGMHLFFIFMEFFIQSFVQVH